MLATSVYAIVKFSRWMLIFYPLHDGCYCYHGDSLGTVSPASDFSSTRASCGTKLGTPLMIGYATPIESHTNSLASLSYLTAYKNFNHMFALPKLP